MTKKSVLFLTGTRAEYGKLKTLMKKVEEDPFFDLQIFVTGMHLLSKYGYTYREIEKDGFKNFYKYINQSHNTTMDNLLSNTIAGLSNYVQEMKPDLIVVHGDRIEALAGAMVGALNNIKVAHIEGGEISGTIDESIRHAITKFAHIHFVSNEEAKNRVIQLGESKETIYIIGSPDIDIMYSKNLPSLKEVKQRYDFNYDKFSIMMYHPVTTEINSLENNIHSLINTLKDTEQQYIVIHPNNDTGSDIIIKAYEQLKDNDNFKVYPSIRFEHFLTLLMHADSIIGNSSAGVREASVYGTPAIDVGNRQKGRYPVKSPSHMIHVSENEDEILNAMNLVQKTKQPPLSNFGDGNSGEKFMNILRDGYIWKQEYQKYFVDLNLNTE